MEIVELPLTATAGTLVRSPERDLTISPSILPLTTISRWALWSFLVDAMDWVSRPAASGSGSDDFFEHPEINRVAARSVASMAKIRRYVDIAAS